MALENTFWHFGVFLFFFYIFITFFTRLDVHAYFGDFLSMFRGSNLGSKMRNHNNNEQTEQMTLPEAPSPLVTVAISVKLSLLAWSSRCN